MAKKNVYEIIEDFKKVKTKSERLDVLRNNDCYALRNVLIGALNPNIVFDVDDMPQWRRVDMPPGMSYDHMAGVLQRVYLLQKDHPRRPAGLTEKRKNELLIQMLESLEEKEADVLIGMLKKDLKVPYLTEALVNEAFPGLLP